MDYKKETLAEYLERTGKHLEDLVPDGTGNNPEQDVKTSYDFAENLYRLFIEEPRLVAEGHRGDFVLLGNGKLLARGKSRPSLVHFSFKYPGSPECFLVAKVGYHNYDNPPEILILDERIE